MADQAAAVEGARNYAKRCIKLAGKWVHRDCMSNMVMFFRLRKEYKEEMSKAWLLYEQHEEATWHRHSHCCYTPQLIHEVSKEAPLTSAIDDFRHRYSTQA